MVARPTPRFGSTRSLSSLLKMSDQVSSAATRTPPSLACRARRRRVRIAPRRQAVVKVDSGMAPERLAHRKALRRLERARPAAAEDEAFGARDMGGERDKCGAIIHQPVEWSADPVPFEHGEFRRVQRRALTVAENMRQRKDLRLACGDELLHREFGRRMQIGVDRRPVRPDERRAKTVEMGLVARRGLKRSRIDFHEIFGLEPAAHETEDLRPRQKRSAASGVAVGAPERRARWTRLKGLQGLEGRITADPGWPSPPESV